MNGFFITGLPGSSYESDIKSIEWAKKKNIKAIFSYYLPMDKEIQYDALFYGKGAKPLSSEYPKNLQKKIYAMAQPISPLHGKMKICHISSYLPQYHKRSGGAEQAAYQTIKLLAENGCHVDVITSKPIKEVKETFSCFSVRTLNNYNYLSQLKSINLPYDPIVFIELLKLLKIIRPNIVHLHNFLDEFSLSALHVLKILKIPVILSIYDYWYFCPNRMLFNKNEDNCLKIQSWSCLDCVKFSGYRSFENLALLFRRMIFNYFLKSVKAFIVLSGSSAKILEKQGIDRKKIHTIPLAFHFDNILNQHVGAIEKNTIVYAGWLVVHKGADIIIKSMRYIIEEVPDAKLYILGMKGDPDYRIKINRLIEEKNLSKHIILVERRLSRQEFLNYFLKANVVVVPEQWQNMLPVVIVEAMFYGKPVVASRIGGIPEFIEEGKNGFLSEPKDPIEFAKKIIWIFKNEEKSEKLAQQAKIDITQLCDKQKISTRLLNLYENL